MQITNLDYREGDRITIERSSSSRTEIYIVITADSNQTELKLQKCFDDKLPVSFILSWQKVIYTGQAIVIATDVEPKKDSKLSFTILLYGETKCQQEVDPRSLVQLGY